MREPPSKALCLYMAEHYWAISPRNEKRSWEYLICWAFYEMYVEGWWQE